MIGASARAALFVFLLLFSAWPGHAQVPAAAAPPPSEGPFTIGFEERFRFEDWDDIIDHDAARDDARRQYRFRTRLWGGVAFGPRVEASVGIVSENRKVTVPDTPVTFDAIIVEQALLTWRPTGAWTVRVGRQNLTRGEGFLLFDGTPLDGSRTAFFNAVVVTRANKRGALDLIGAFTARSADYLPKVNGLPPWKFMSEWDESLLGAYWSARVATGTWDAYVLTKGDTGDVRVPGAVGYHSDRWVTATGGRADVIVRTGWSVATEFTGQFGTQESAVAGTPDAALRAWGGYARVRRQFASRTKPTVEIGYGAMSGDDPSTPALEAWDPMFARWPRESELLGYTAAPENGPSYYTNQHGWRAQVTATPSPHVVLRATYHWLRAFEPVRDRPATFGDGLARGRLWQARGEWTAAPHWRAHALFEHFTPGDFYASRDVGYLLQVQAAYSISKRF